MKRLSGKIFVLILIISLISSITLFTYGCKEEEKKAILIIHGICGGAFFDAETDEAIWALDMIDINELTTMLSDPTEMMNKMSLDENGVPTHDLRVADMDDTRGKYTMLSMFQPVYEKLEADYGDEYEVIIWQYDWRLDNIQTADKLDNFIKENDYDKLIFVTHSMGGNVVSQYLTKGQDRRDKVELFIPISTPFFGSNEAYYFIADGLISNVGGLLNSVPMANGRVDFSPFYSGIIPTLVNGIKPMLHDLGSNLPSLYMLSPFEEFSDTALYQEGQTPIKLDGEYVDYDAAFKYFSGLDFAKKENGELKPGFALCEDYQAGHMVDKDGKIVHISNLVNTHYIAGSGVQTLKTLNINSATGQIINIEQTADGDGVVSVFSSTAGNPLDADNVYIMNGSSHVSVTSDQQVVDTVKQIIEEYLGH